MQRTTEWLNQNRYRNYPFVEDTVPTCNGAPLPLNFLVDFSLIDYTHKVTATAIYLTSIEWATPEIILSFGRSPNATDYSVSVPVNAALPYTARTSYDSQGVHYDLVCTVDAGLEVIGGWVENTYAVTNAKLEPARWQFQTRHRLLSIIGDSPSSVPVYGDIHFEEGYGIGITVTPALDQIRITAAPGSGKGRPCDDIAIGTIKLILIDDVTPLDGTVTVDGITYVFVPNDDSSGSSSGEELDPGAVAVVLGATNLDTLTNLATSIGVMTPDALVSITQDADVYTLNVERDDLLVANSWHTSVQLTLVQLYGGSTCKSAVLFFNDVTADGFGNMQLIGGKGIAITNKPDDHEIVIENKLDNSNLDCNT